MTNRTRCALPTALPTALRRASGVLISTGCTAWQPDSGRVRCGSTPTVTPMCGYRGVGQVSRDLGVSMARLRSRTSPSRRLFGWLLINSPAGLGLLRGGGWRGGLRCWRRRHDDQLHGRERQLIELVAPVGHVVEQPLAHATRPELVDVVGNAIQRRLSVRLGAEETANVIRHPDDLLRPFAAH